MEFQVSINTQNNFLKLTSLIQKQIIIPLIVSFRSEITVKKGIQSNL
jgi:hypothetical protein